MATSSASLDERSMKQFFVPLATKVPAAECKQAFELLTDKEKLYVHHWSKASWVGGLIILLQTSPESPAIFVLLQNLFRHNSLEDLEKLAKQECDFSDNDWLALKFYAGGVYHNMGNYVGFGDTKLVPEISKEKLKKLVLSSNGPPKNHNLLHDLWKSCGDRMFDLTIPRLRQLGLKESLRYSGKSNGITTYFSWNCDQVDADLVKDFLVEQGIEAYNTRVFKTHSGSKALYEVRFASAKEVGNVDAGKLKINGSPVEFRDAKFVLKNGDYGPFMAEMARSLKEAVKHAANDTEKQMLENYVKSFESGSLDAHKEGSRHWIKNKKPVVEGYIGFIETYRDPAGQRGEFEGFVAVVDKEKSARLNVLVDKAEEIISQLPWPKEYEKDTYLRPDYSELTVVAFASSGIPIGINIPNYDEIRQNEGFKNVSLGNVIAAALKSRPPQFISQENHDILTKHETLVLEIQVALHELLGHGSGKLLQKQQDGSFNFTEGLEDFESGSECGYYEPGQTYDSVFGSLASTYEECRAETIAIYLCLLPEVLEVWGIKKEDAEDVIYGIWLAMALSGLKSLPYYIVEQEKWGQAHAQGRFAILRVLQEANMVDVKIVTGNDGKPDLLLTLDRKMIHKEGKEAIGNFLKRLQLNKLFIKDGSETDLKKYSVLCLKTAVESSLLLETVNDVREFPIVLIRLYEVRDWSRKMECGSPAFVSNGLVQVNTIIDSDQKVGIKSYPASIDGMIQSFQERYDHPDILEDALLKAAERDSVYFTSSAL